MTNYILETDKKRLRGYLLNNPHMNLYHLGDLDDFFWPHTRWYTRQQDGDLTAVALFYTGEEPPVLLAILNENQEEMTALVEELIPVLPNQLYAHLSPEMEALFAADYRIVQDYGEHYKMALTGLDKLHQIDTSNVIPLTLDDLPRLEALYTAAYPGNWFNPRMLETGQYTGIPDADGRLLCVAGIHVYSPEYKVAALGNITTLPEYRGRGLAATVTAGLCKQLLQTVDMIGLNVKINNPAAIRAYTRIGFEPVGVYHEWMMERRS
jgi:ribosomal protein S18 acetylase RimI-like enzyme